MAEESGSNVTTDPIHIPKLATGIAGLDDVLFGGIPEHRVTLLKGAAGTGKTILGLECLFHAARTGRPVICVCFEETAEALRQNAKAMGWDIAALEETGLFFLWEARIDRRAIYSGDFSIESLLGVLGAKAEQMGASLIMIDAVDVLVSLFSDTAKEHNELYRLHDWLAEKRFTALLTAKIKSQTNDNHCYELLDYMAGCVIHLDLRVLNQIATRRLRVIKYRGSGFCSNEYPYLIGRDGNVVMPITAVRLLHRSLDEKVSSGHQTFDSSLGGGFFRGSSILFAGPSGSGKTTFAATFTQHACTQGRPVLYISFEESQEAILSAMRSPGIVLDDAVNTGMLEFHTIMPEALVAEEHLYQIILKLNKLRPAHLVVDSISACRRMGGDKTAFDFLVRLINLCKQRHMTCMMTNQREQDDPAPARGLSSILDAMILLSFAERDRIIERDLIIVKSRGTHHSNRRHGFRITNTGIQFRPLDTQEGQAQ